MNLNIDKMENYSKNEIESLVTRFEARQLSKPEWTHSAHLILAICYSTSCSSEEAIDRARENISKFNLSVGTENTDTGGYHESITKFWIWVAKEYLKDNQFDSLTQTCNSFINSEFACRELPLRYYTKDVLFSVEARHNWVEPDICEMESLTVLS